MQKFVLIYKFALNLFIKTNQLMLYGEIHINTVCGQNIKL